jgi:hypothetical protein
MNSADGLQPLLIRTLPVLSTHNYQLPDQPAIVDKYLNSLWKM